MTYEKYALIQRLLHWIIALLVLGALAGGLVLEQLGDGPFKDDLAGLKPYTNQIYFLHKSAGMTVLLLMVVRIAARLVYGAPDLPVTVPDWQARIAGLSHFAFYVLLIAMPVLGWLATSAYEAPVPLFGLYDFPMLIEKDRAFAEKLYWIHGIMGKVLLAIVLLHIGAALMHGIVKRDGVFGRMWF